MSRIRELIDRLDEELPLAERVSISTELYQLTGERFGSDANAWRAWLAAQKKPVVAPPSVKRLVDTDEFAEARRLGLISPEALPHWVRELEAGDRATQELFHRIADGRTLAIPRLRSEFGLSEAMSLRAMTDRAFVVPDSVSRRTRGPIEIQHGAALIQLEKDWRPRLLALLAQWAVQLTDGRRIYSRACEEETELWLLTEPQARFLAEKGGLALSPLDPSAPAPARPRTDSWVDELIDVVGEERVVILDAEGFDSAETYEAVLPTLLGDAVDGLEIECHEDDEGRHLRLSWEGGQTGATLEGDTDWLDREPMVEAVNRMLAARKLAERLVAFDPYESQEVGFVLVPDRLAEGVRVLLGKKAL